MPSTASNKGYIARNLAVAILLGVALLLGISAVSLATHRRPEEIIMSNLGISESTIASLKRDERLGHGYASTIRIGAVGAKALAKRLEMPALAHLGADLDEHLKKRGYREKRQDLEAGAGGVNNKAGLSGAGLPGAGLLGAGLPGAGLPGAGSPGAGLPGAGGLDAFASMLSSGNMTSIMSAMMSSLMGMAASSSPGILDGLGMFLGLGLGEGAVQGLNLSTAANAKAVGQKIAKDNNMTASGLNPLILNAASGATASLIGSVNISSINITSLTGVDLASQLAPGLLGLGQGIGGGAATGLQLTQKDVAPNPNATDIGGLLSNFGFGLTSSATGSINTTALFQSATSGMNTAGIIKALPAALSGFGKGLGNGAVIGLGYQSDQPIPIQTMPDGSADISGIAQSFSQSLTSSFLANGTTSKLTSNLSLSSLGVSTGNIDFGRVATGFGKGLGGGAVIGLGYQPDEAVLVQMMPDGNPDFGGIAQSFAQSLTSSFLANGTTSKITSNISLSSLGVSTGSIDFGRVATGFGKGLGGGAVIGLGVQPDEPVLVQMMPGGNPDLGGIAQSFAQSLTSSFLVNGTASKLTSNLSLSSLGVSTGNIDFARVASGFGKGLGGGAAIGLGVQADEPVPVQMMPDGNPDYGGIAQSFAQSLTSSFLANSTTTKLLNSLNTTTATSNLDFNRVAQGFARGFIQGAGDGVDSLGGMQAVINGTSKMPASPYDVGGTPLQFNDSVNGAATGFGQGLGSQGVLLIQRLFSNSSSMGSLATPTESVVSAAPPPALAVPAVVPTIPASGENTETPGSSETSSISTSNMTIRSRLPSRLPAVRRQLDISQGMNSVNLSLMLSADTISTVLQKGTDALTCEGVGGIGLMSLGLLKSGTISFNSFSFDSNTTKLIKGLIPDGVIRLASANVVYEIDGPKIRNALDSSSLVDSADGVQVNGTKVIPFAVFLIIHSMAPSYGLWDPY
ncbi:hypothetical protein GQ53DRAFT_835257 [Thozetella sp. PMI_491]|nr:hypothetical protein GQ53DRAFT_835257 [Thozetella sp. PMI_491]